MVPSPAHLSCMTPLPLPLFCSPCVHDFYAIPCRLSSLLTTHMAYEHLISPQPSFLAIGGLIARLSAAQIFHILSSRTAKDGGNIS